MKSPKILSAVAALLLLVLFVVPLWRITLEAPQYPDGITMYIWINKITGDTEYTLQNINILNHYIGMKYIEPDSIPELQYFPYVVIFMAVFGFLVAFTNSRNLRLTWLLILLILGILGIYDFYLWEYDYGHNLSPTAPIKIPGMAYQPPLFGTEMLLNFKASSYPHWGGIALFFSLLLGFLAYWRSKGAAARISSVSPAAAVILSMVLLGCSKDPQAIAYGMEGCNYCKMTIVDTRFGAELVTDKGKILKFDGVECLVNHLQSSDDQKVHSLWVTSFDKPQQLVEASSCKYLISRGIPSPMGMYLSAFDTQQAAQSFQQKHGGTVYDWSTLNQNFQGLQVHE